MPIFSTRPVHMMNASKAGDRRGTIVMSFLRVPTKIISSLQVIATLLAIVLGSQLQPLFTNPLASRITWLPVQSAQVLAYWTVIAISTLVTMVLTNLIPKRLAYAYADPLSLSWARVVYYYHRATRPLAVILTWVADGLIRLFRVPIPKGAPVKEADIRELLRQGALHGTIDRDEQGIAVAAFALSDHSVQSFMTPRALIEGIDLDQPDSDVRNQVAMSRRSLYPAFHGDLDASIGVLRARDILVEPDVAIIGQIRPIVRIPAGFSALDLLQRFRTEPARAALVVDDQGCVLGMITFNDVIGVLLGGDCQAIQV